MINACAILAASASAASQLSLGNSSLDNRPDEGFGTLFGSLGGLDSTPDAINPNGGTREHPVGASVAHIDLAMACIDETEDIKNDMTTLSSKCLQTEVDAMTLSTEVTTLATALETIKTSIATNSNDLSKLKAQNAGQDSLIVEADGEISKLEAAMLELEAESIALLAYVDLLYTDSTNNVFYNMVSDIDLVDDYQQMISSTTSVEYQIEQLATQRSTLTSNVKTADANADALIARIDTFEASIAEQTMIVAAQTAELTALGTMYTDLGALFGPQKIKSDYFTINTDPQPFAMNDDDGLTEFAEFCIMDAGMVEFNLAATTSPGDTAWNVQSWQLVDDDDTVLARSEYNYVTQRGRTFTLQYKAVVAAEATFKIQVQTHSVDDPVDDTTAPFADALNVQWGVRQYSADYVLDSTSDTC